MITRTDVYSGHCFWLSVASGLVDFFYSHFDSLCPPGKSVLKSKEQQMTSELRPSNSSLTAEEQEKEQEKVRLAWTYIFIFNEILRNQSSRCLKS